MWYKATEISLLKQRVAVLEQKLETYTSVYADEYSFHTRPNCQLRITTVVYMILRHLKLKLVKKPEVMATFDLEEIKCASPK